MVEIKGKHFCENCFEECTTPYCTHCGYNPSAGTNDPTILAPGSVLLGKYIVGKVMGKGGFGITYLAYDITVDRKVAIKEYFPYGVALRAGVSPTVSVSTMENAEAFKLGAEKFYDEAKLVSKFNGNPNIVGVYEFFYENDTVYFAMEYLQGQTLKDHISEHGVINAQQALFLAQNVSNALMAAHSANVLHRDISPDNIILCDDGSVKLIDFGAARQVLAEHSQSFSVILKPGFAPLEQYQKKGNQGPWSDIYALGTTLYFSLTEDIPEDPMSRLDDDSTFGENKFGVETEIWEIICKATQLKIDDRYGDTFQLRNDLSKVSYKPEPLVTPKEKPEEHMPEFRTAMPFGMAQTKKQPVTVGAPANAAPAASAVGQPQGSAASVSAPVPASVAPQKKKSPIGLIIGIAAGSFVLVGGIIAAVLMPTIMGMANKSHTTSDVYNNSQSFSQPGGSSDMSGSESLSDTPSQPQTTSQPQAPKVNIPSNKAYYSTINNDYKQLYEFIYDGISKRSASIAIPSVYNEDLTDLMYYYVLYDNPQFYYVNDYEAKGSNIVPHYIETNDTTMKKLISDLISIAKEMDTIDALTEIHDMYIQQLTAVDRYQNSTCTTAYGTMIIQQADDLCMAKGFCYLAQEMGLRCVVVDGTFKGKNRAWCRVEVKGVWYNVDVYGDMSVYSYADKDWEIKKGDIFRSFFLANDTFFTASGYKANAEYDPFVNKYPANSEYASYYIQKYQSILDGYEDKYYTYYYTVDEAYNNVLSYSASQINAGRSGAAWSVSPLIIDDLWIKIENDLGNDLYNKYGISMDRNLWEYNSDKLSVTFG